MIWSEATSTSAGQAGKHYCTPGWFHFVLQMIKVLYASLRVVYLAERAHPSLQQPHTHAEVLCPTLC